MHNLIENYTKILYWHFDILNIHSEITYIIIKIYSPYHCDLYNNEL